MKEFQLVVREDFVSENIAKKFRETLLSHEWVESNNPEMVIAIGGDGVMLKAFKDYGEGNASFVGVHTGTLGFYADWNVSESEKLLDLILKQEYETIEYPLVEFNFESKNGKILTKYTLNEGIIKSPDLSTFVIEVFLNNEPFETFRGDGLVISSPSGSTAYNYSTNGAIVHPSLEVIQVSELAAINNVKYRTLGRSFILPKHHKMVLYPQRNNVLIGLDGFELDLKDIRRVSCSVSNKKVKFLRYKHFPFWTRVKEAFIKND